MAKTDTTSFEAELLDVRQAARIAGRHPETVRRWIWSGRLVAQRRGNRLLVAREDVEALAGDGGKTPATLAEWGERARAVASSAAASCPPRGAADLVIEDRARRSQSSEA